MKFHILTAALALCAALALPACKTFQADSSATQAAKIAVQYGTMRYLGNVPEAERTSKAARVRAIVSEVSELAKGQPVTLTLLDEAVRKLLPDDLRPEDAFAINALLGLVMNELRARVGDGLLTEEQLLQVSVVASWVVEATELYST